MIHVTDVYFKALETLDASAIPWAEDAFRIENGMVTCGTVPNMAPPVPRTRPTTSCISPDGKVPYALKVVYNVLPRRTPVVDVEKGITWGLYCFNHRGLDTIELPDGSVIQSGFKTPNTMPWADMYKTKNGKLRGIFAFGIMLPYGIGDGWSGPLFK